MKKSPFTSKKLLPPPEHHVITGAAGFIGSHLVYRLLSQGHRVSGLDDLSRGRAEHLDQAKESKRFFFQKTDLSSERKTLGSLRACERALDTVDVIWHLAANSDIPAGVADANIDFRNTLLTTFSVLQAAKALGVKRAAFASSSAVYGERGDLLEEDSGPLLPISNYGACKLAGEGLLSAAAESWLERIWIFRFPNVVGPQATHGALFDFVRRLRSRPNQLSVLGDGTQRKPYLHVSELIDAICFIVAFANASRNVFNIAPKRGLTSVAFIAQQTVARVRPGAGIVYSAGDRGWIGDVPRFRYSTKKLARLGWRSKLTSDEAVVRAIDELAKEYGF